MDVVADAGAVGGRIVGAEHHQRRGPLGGLQHVRDEVCLGVVLLAIPLRRAGRIEVAQADAAQAVGRRVPAQRALEGAFRLAVWVDRGEWGMLLDRDRGRDTIDGGTRREHDPSHAGVMGGIEQGNAAGHVVAVVPGRFRDGFTDQGAGCAVQDRLDALAPEQLAQGAPVRVRPDRQARARNERRSVAGAEVVEDAHLVARHQQSLHAHRTDVAGSAGHQDPQCLTSAPRADYRR